jgi:hypothetical protein
MPGTHRGSHRLRSRTPGPRSRQRPRHRSDTRWLGSRRREPTNGLADLVHRHLTGTFAEYRHRDRHTDLLFVRCRPVRGAPSLTRPRSTSRCSTATPSGSYLLRRRCLRRRRAPRGARSPGHLWLEDPPATGGRKVIISDTDHYAPAAATTLGLKILPERQPFHPAELRIIDGQPARPAAGRAARPRRSCRSARSGRGAVARVETARPPPIHAPSAGPPRVVRSRGGAGAPGLPGHCTHGCDPLRTRRYHHADAHSPPGGKP